MPTTPRIGARVLLLDTTDRMLLIQALDPRTPVITGGSCPTSASRELRNDTAAVLRRVQAGEEVTVNGKPVAQLIPLQQTRRRWLPRSELARRLRVAQADPGLRDDLAILAGDTTDQLGPIR